MNQGKYLLSMAVLVGLLSSCGSMQQVAQHDDDVYFVPSDRAVQPAAAAPTEEEAPATATTTSSSDDYYDPQTAATASQGSYYDMAYNDPYYYNYGRFGFGTSLAMQNGWFMGPSGIAMQWGYGTGFYGGWFRPHGFSIGIGYGWGNSPWYYGNSGYWGSYGWFNNPYNNYGYGWGPGCGGYYNGWDPGGFGYGYGPYSGPYGSCWGCYSPIVIAGNSNTVYGHRPSLSGIGNRTTDGGQPRSLYRDPVRLTTAIERPYRSNPNSSGTISNRKVDRSGSWTTDRPAPSHRPAERHHSEGTTRTPRPESRDRGGIQFGGGSDRGGGGGGGFPSRSGGGGGSSSGGHRAR